MTLPELYESVVRQCETGQDTFLDAYNRTVDALCAEYGPQYVLTCGQAPTAAQHLSDAVQVRELYRPALLEGILYCLTGSAERRSSYRLCAAGAYACVRRASDVRVSPRRF